MPTEPVGIDRPAAGGEEMQHRGSVGEDGSGALRPRLRRRSWEVRAQAAIDALRLVAHEVALTREPGAEPEPQQQVDSRNRPGGHERRLRDRLADWWVSGAAARHTAPVTSDPGCTQGTPWCDGYHHVLSQLRIAESYLDHRGTPMTWWRGIRVEGAWGHIHNATVALVQLASSTQLFAMAPRLLGIIDGYLKQDDPERRAVQSWFDELPRVAAPPLRMSGDSSPRRERKSAGAAVPYMPAGPPTAGEVTERARGALASALQTAYARIAAEYQRLRRFEWTIIGSTLLILGLVALLAVLGWREPQVVPLCFPDPDETTTTAAVTTPPVTTAADVGAEAPASEDPTGATQTTTTVGERPPVCPSRDRPAAAGTAGDAGADREGAPTGHADESPMSSGDVATVLLFGLIGASLTSVPFVVRRAPPTSVPISGIRVAQAGLKAALGMLSAVTGLLFLRAGVVPGFTQVDTRSQILMYALLFGAAQQLVTRAIDSRSNTLIEAVTADDVDTAAASRSQ